MAKTVEETMRAWRRWVATAALTLTATAACVSTGCDGDKDETDTAPADTVALDSVKDVATDVVASLRWYTTCGDPVCSGHTPQPGIDACTDQVVGAACTVESALCDPGDSCNASLVCAKADPKQQPGGCPISAQRHKTAIHYLGQAELEAVHDAATQLPLASWRYHWDAAERTKRLGVILEDIPGSPAADAEREQVDLYGYSSMAIAALQVQAKRIEALEAGLRELLKRLDERAASGPSGRDATR